MVKFSRGQIWSTVLSYFQIFHGTERGGSGLLNFRWEKQWTILSTKQNEDKIVPLLGCLVKAERLQRGYQIIVPWSMKACAVVTRCNFRNNGGITKFSLQIFFFFFFHLSLLSGTFACSSERTEVMSFDLFLEGKFFWGFNQEHCNAKHATIKENRNTFSEWVYQSFSCSHLLSCVLLGKNFWFSCTPEEPCDTYSEEFVSV